MQTSPYVSSRSLLFTTLFIFVAFSQSDSRRSPNSLRVRKSLDEVENADLISSLSTLAKENAELRTYVNALKAALDAQLSGMSDGENHVCFYCLALIAEGFLCFLLGCSHRGA
jgi:hypothetical protein